MLQQQTTPFAKKMRVGSEREHKNIAIPTTDKKIPMKSLIRANGLNYTFPSQASGVRTRQFKCHYFDKSSYTSGSKVTATCFINSGADFIDTNHSYLTFELKATLVVGAALDTATMFDEGGIYQDGVTFGSSSLAPKVPDAPFDEDGAISYNTSYGSAINLFREVRNITKSGQEVERIRDLNLLQYHCLPYKNSLAYHTKAHSMSGSDYTFFREDFKTMDGVWAAGTYTDSIKNVVIPMQLLSGLWAGPGPTKLMPAQLASGLKLEFELETAANAFSLGISPRPLSLVNPGGNEAALTISYELVNMRVVCDSVLLADSILHTLNKVASGTDKSSHGGLEYYFETWDTTEVATQGGSKNLNFETRKAASRALSNFSVIRPLEASNSIWYSYFRGRDVYPVETVQHRLGSFFYPNKKVDNDTEAYYYALWASDKVNMNEELSQNISLDQFQNEGIGHTAVTFERSSILPLTGVPMNNSRTLSTDITLKDNEFQNAQRVHSFLRYVKLVRVFQNNVVIRE